MSFIDIGIIAVIVLGALIGLYKGFFKSVISFFGWFVTLILAVLLAKVVALALLDISAVQTFVLGRGEGFSLYSWSYSTLVPDAIKNLGMSASIGDIETALSGNFLAAIFKSLCNVVISSMGGTAMQNVGEGLALLLANGIFTLMVGIGLFIAIRIVLSLITMFARTLVKNKKIGIFNRFMGFILGAVQGFGIVVIFFAVTGFFMSASFMAPVKKDLDKSVIGSKIAPYVYQLTDEYFKKPSDELLKRILIYSGFDSAEENPDEGYTMTAGETELKSAVEGALTPSESGVTINDYKNADYNNYLEPLLAYNNAIVAKLTAEGVGASDIGPITASFADTTDPEALGTLYQKLMSDMKLYMEMTDATLAEDKAAKLNEITAVFTAVKGAYTALGAEDIFGELVFTSPVVPDPVVPGPANAPLVFLPALA